MPVLFHTSCENVLCFMNILFESLNYTMKYLYHNLCKGVQTMSCTNLVMKHHFISTLWKSSAYTVFSYKNEFLDVIQTIPVM